MNKTFVQRCIILPVIAAVLIGALFFLLTNTTRSLAVGEEMMYHDALNPSNTMVKNRNELTENALLGIITGGGKDLALRYEADYVNLKDSASLLSQGRIVGETGTAYIRIGNHNADVFGESFRYSGTFGELNYHLKDEVTVKNEAAVFTMSANANSSAVVYYLVCDHGLSTQYKVLVYEEG